MQTVPVYRVALVREGRQAVESKYISSPEEAAAVFRAYIGNADRETFAVMALSVKNEIIGVHTVSIGTLDSAVIHPRELFKPLLLLNASSAIVAHNHPSGDLTPSPEDRAVTERLVEAGNILGIDIVDHLVVSSEAFGSLRQLGLL